MAMFNQRFSSSSLRLSTGSSLRLIAAVALSAGMGVSVTNAQEINDQGWTVLEPSADTRFVFVSSSTGNDSNSGFSPSKAVKTFERARELIRNNSADWMLLNRGDVWHETLGTWSNSGRSAEDRIVITSYGESDERPKIVISSGSAITGRMNSDVNNVAIVGIHMAGDRPDEASVRGVRWLSTGENLLIEDCLIEGFKDNIICEAVGGEFHNLALRRSVIVDSWSTDGHSQGMYVDRTFGLVLEENVFDHNGWNESVAAANPTMFNHNLYLQEGVMGIEFHGNITARSSGAGIQMRSGGHASHNLLYANPLGIRFGYRTIDWPTESASGSITNNVVLGGHLSDQSLTGSGIAYWVERSSDTLVKDNVAAEFLEGSVAWAYTLHAHAQNVEFIGNVAYEWVDPSGVGRAIKSAAQIHGDVRFAENQWHMPGTNRLIELGHIDGIEFVGNDMFGFDADDDVFSVEGSSINFDEWLSRANVEDDDLEAPVFPDAGRDLDGYAQHLGFTDADEFLQAARGQSRTHWDPRLTGRAAAGWISAGYIVQD